MVRHVASCCDAIVTICAQYLMIVVILQDYPSLAQLHDKLQQSNVLPIFAVVKEVSSLYQVMIDCVV